jgi:lipid-A-disaccharide synthase
MNRNLDVFMVAGEVSGDILGAGLIRALRESRRDAIFRGIGGSQMIEAGLTGLYSMQDVATIGLMPVLTKLPTIIRRLHATVEAIVAQPPDILVLIDAPDFTHRVASRVRARLPGLPIVKYVSPSVWVWRPGRARAMRGSIDLVLALLPFEPGVHQELGGPPCIYVGHPILDRLAELRPLAGGQNSPGDGPPVVLVLPGSRPREIRRLGPVFGHSLRLLEAQKGRFELILPTLPHLRHEVTTATRNWAVVPQIVVTEAEKEAAFRRARVALAASGTVTLELALAGIPHVAGYRLPLLEGLLIQTLARFHPSLNVRSVLLPNLILGKRVIPEFLQNRCTPANLAAALAEIFDDGSAREQQISAFKQLEIAMDTAGIAPSRRAADAVLALLAKSELTEPAGQYAARAI